MQWVQGREQQMALRQWSPNAFPMEFLIYQALPTKTSSNFECGHVSPLTWCLRHYDWPPAPPASGLGPYSLHLWKSPPPNALQQSTYQTCTGHCEGNGVWEALCALSADLVPSLQERIGSWLWRYTIKLGESLSSQWKSNTSWKRATGPWNCLPIICPPFPADIWNCTGTKSCARPSVVVQPDQAGVEERNDANAL